MLKKHLTREGKRRLVQELHDKGLTIDAALKIAGIKRSTYYYRSTVKGSDEVLLEKIKEIAFKHPYYGYRRIWAVLRRQGYKVNKKRVYRLYSMAELVLFTKKRERKKGGDKYEVIEAERINHIWSMDFCFIRAGNRRIKVLAIEDEYSRVALGIFCGYSMTGEDVASAIKKTMGIWGKPEYIKSDNGPEFRSRVLERFMEKNRIKSSFIEKGKPYQNGHTERFIGSLKKECLLTEDFENLHEVNESVRRYREFYNKERPHQSLDYQTPLEYYQKEVKSVKIC